MKTSKIINMLTNATSVLLHAMNMVNHVIKNSTDEDKSQDEIVRDAISEAPHTILSYPSDTVRDLIDLLPESCITEEIAEARNNLYPHKFKDDYTKFMPLVSQVFHFSHDLSTEMYATKKKFGFED